MTVTALSTQAGPDIPPPPVATNDPMAPTRVADSDTLMQLAFFLQRLFDQYKQDRRVAEQRWLRSLRQYLGIYDPEVESTLSKDRSRAYPKITRVKCITTLARIMNLMFQGDEKNWLLKASPSPDMEPADIMQAIQELIQRYQKDGIEPILDDETVEHAVGTLAKKRAEQLETLINDQLQELGGDQTFDYVALVRAVLISGILYGLGVLRGPFARAEEVTRWRFNPMTRLPEPYQTTIYKPMFETVSVWDFYPDMSSKSLLNMDGYFIRSTMSRTQLLKLADRSDFMADQINKYLNENSSGNWKAQWYELELRTMGVKINVNENKAESTKYEVISYCGPVTGHMLQKAGAEIDPEDLHKQVDAEIWMVGNTIIKAKLNPWKSIGQDVRMIHPFVFEEDDTSPVGSGLPNVVRDSQMNICAAVRMVLDNASVVCGPNLELNMSLLRRDQDLSAVSAYKIWYREDDEPATTATAQAVRNVTIDGHIDELLKLIELFMKFADMETFVGPATGGDFDKAPSEPFRTAAGASMLRGDAALPFKDIIRQFDRFTQSVIYSIVQFNRLLNVGTTPAGDFNVIARGATSLVAKEVRGMQVDALAATLTPEERVHLDERKLTEERLKVRDLGDLLVSPEEAARRKLASQQAQQTMQDQQRELLMAEVRKTLADAFKAITQGQKNSAAADAQSVQTVLNVLEAGMQDGQEDKAAGAAGSNSKRPAK